MFIFLTFGCSMENGLNLFPDGWGRSDIPKIQVTPDHLPYGAVGFEAMKTLDFKVTNVGDKNSILTIGRVTIDTPDGFQFTADIRDTDLGQGDSKRASVTFSPSDPVFYEGLVTVESNDERNPAVPVRLDGSGLMPKLRITPDPYDFGHHMVGCERVGTVTLENVGTDELIVDGIEQSGAAFTVIEKPAFPLSLMPGETGEVTLVFAPRAAMLYDGELLALSNDPEGERAAMQFGEGTSPQHFVDTYELPIDPPVDISFFIDRSRSTGDDQSALASNVESFITKLAAETPDWQVMVITEDDGCTTSGVLTSDTPDFVARFSAATPGGEGGGIYTEAGLIVTTNAMRNIGPGQCNDGFHRDGAYYHAIMVSDEPEQSPEPWYVYVRELRSIVGDPLKLRISAVAGDIPTGCHTDINSAAPGRGYHEAAMATDGVFLSLCDEWSNHVDTLVRATVSRGTFDLTRTPVPASVRTWVNAVEQFGDWTYDAGMNAVIFNEMAQPSEGDLVQVEYDEPSVCD
ncbi:MAG: choice-of-anchor D domain-containing protein [Candidatus Uhrbacteria bacterium]|nr:choice-of-anchor D domain-containing protein [Candidatus Uhrbacteria bacterium]